MNKYVILSLVSFLFCSYSYGMFQDINPYSALKNDIEMLLKNETDPQDAKLQECLFKCSIGDYFSPFLKLLLEYGVNPNIQQNTSLLTPLHICTMHGNLKNIELLLQHQANPNVADSLGETPLMLILRPSLGVPLDKKKHKTVIWQLLKGGCDTKVLNNSGETAADIARNNNFDYYAEMIEHYPFPISLKEQAIRFVKANKAWYTNKKLNTLPGSLKILVSTCNHCKREHSDKHQLKLCTGCREVYYCDKFCQKKNWSSHKAECGKFKKKNSV